MTQYSAFQTLSTQLFPSPHGSPPTYQTLPAEFLFIVTHPVPRHVELDGKWAADKLARKGVGTTLYGS